jgi:hypothetical protein
MNLTKYSLAAGAAAAMCATPALASGNLSWEAREAEAQDRYQQNWNNEQGLWWEAKLKGELYLAVELYKSISRLKDMMQAAQDMKLSPYYTNLWAQESSMAVAQAKALWPAGKQLHWWNLSEWWDFIKAQFYWSMGRDDSNPLALSIAREVKYSKKLIAQMSDPVFYGTEHVPFAIDHISSASPYALMELKTAQAGIMEDYQRILDEAKCFWVKTPEAADEFGRYAHDPNIATLR